MLECQTYKPKHKPLIPYLVSLQLEFIRSTYEQEQTQKLNSAEKHRQQNHFGIYLCKDICVRR